MTSDLAGLLRAWGVAAAALLVLFLGYWESQAHGVTPASAPATQFSAARAETVLARILGPERPHPVGSAENAALRARVIAEFAALGIKAETYRAFTCSAWRKLSYVACATVTDVVAQVLPGQGKAVVLLAHYDSVPAGPGASDDESGVATVLETARALRARHQASLHPVLAVITDGEEGGLLGANAFLENAALKARVGAVVNVEARGTRGKSLLFQTSPGDGRLIDLYAAHVPVYATSSLYAEIYRFLPNDTDLTLFIRDGFPAFNFAFSDNVHYYHSPFDIRANLDPATLQMQGDNMLGVAGALTATPFAALKGGNDIYFSLFGAVLPRLPASWALPLAIATLFLLLAAGVLAPSAAPFSWGRLARGVAAPPLLVLGCVLGGWLLSVVAQWVSHHPDPTYAYPLAMRIGLCAAVWAVTLAAARLSDVKSAVLAAWLWPAALGVVTAALLPGISPYFVFPALVAAVVLVATARWGWSSGWGQFAVALAALAAFFVWLPISVSGESLMGLRLHPLFTLPAAFALMAALPLLAAKPLSAATFRVNAGLSALAALACAGIAGLMPTYSARDPQRVDLAYFEYGTAPARFIAATSWKATSTEPIPAELLKAGPFRYDAQAFGGTGLGDGYVAPGGAPLFAVPKGRAIADLVSDTTRTVELRFALSDRADGFSLHVPKEAHLESLSIRGEHLVSKGYAGDTQILCLTPDCRDLAVTLVLGTRGGLSIPFAELRYGLPASGARLKAARPATAMASQSGDETVLADRVILPAR